MCSASTTTIRVGVPMAACITFSAARSTCHMPRKPDTHTPPLPGVRSPVGRYTWLSAFAEVWKAAYGGDLPYKQAGQVLKNPVAELGADEVLGRWRSYCAKTQAPYASVSKFAQTIGQWKVQATRPQPPKVPPVRTQKPQDAPLTAAEWQGQADQIRASLATA